MSYFKNGAPPQVQPKHASIVQAICRVQTSMEAVKKSAKNQHGGYNYASADDIYAAVIRRMAEAGLVIDALEVVPPQISKSDKGSQWMRVTFQFVLSTTESTWTDASARRTVMLPMNGPQSFMAAQSYAEKAYLRSLFKLATGDMELDEIYSIEDGAPKKITSASAKWANVWADAQEAVASAEDLSTLAQIDQEWRPKLPPKWADPFSDLIANRNQEILASMS